MATVEHIAHPDCKQQAMSRRERRLQKQHSRVAELQPLKDKLASEDWAVQLEAARELRQQLDGPHAIHLDDVIHAEIVPRLVQLSRDSSRHDLEFELLWALTLLTQGTAEQTKDVVADGAVGVFKQLVSSADASVREQALTILGNVAEASAELRDEVIASGATTAIIKMLTADQEQEHVSYYDEKDKLWKLRCGQPEQPVSVVRSAARTLALLCSGEPRPDFGAEMKALLHMLETLTMSTDEQVLVRACTALSHLQYGAAERVELLVKDGVCGRLVELLAHSSLEVRCVAALAAEKIATGTPKGMEAILQCKPLPALKGMLEGKEAPLQRDGCSVVADVLSLGGAHFQEVIDEGLVPPLLALLRSADEEVKRTAARAVGALSCKCSPEQTEALIDGACVAAMVKMLETTAFHSSEDVGRAALDFVDNVLRAGKQLQQAKGLPENRFAKQVKEADGVRMLQGVTEMSDRGDVCAKAKAILASL